MSRPRRRRWNLTRVELQDQEKILKKQFAEQGETLLKQHQLALEEDRVKRAREESEQMAKQLRDSLTQGLHEYMAQSYPNASELKHLRAQVKAVIRHGWQIPGTPYTLAPIPSIQEFLKILEVRREQIKEVIDTGDLSLKWKWPAEWGYVPWSGPIITERIRNY